MKNWFDHILFHARAQSDKPAIVMEDRAVTYGMLLRAIESCAHRLAGMNIDRDSVVAVLVENPIRHLTLCLALYRIGIVTMSLEHDQGGVRELSYSAVLADDRARRDLGPTTRLIEVGDAWFAEDATRGSYKLTNGFFASSQICRHSLTSGATGAPKIVMHSIDDVGRRIPPFIDLNWSIALCLPGLSSNWGFTTCCAVLATGRTLCFAASPYQAIRIIQLFSIDFVMASTEQLLALTRVARKSAAQLTSLRTVWFGGTVPSRALIEAALIYLCRNILCRYAGSELGHMAQATASEVLSNPGLVGRVVPGVEVAIFDSLGGRCPPGQIGVIKARLMDEFAGPSSKTNDEPTSWIDLNDMGWMTADEQLYVVGRTSDAGKDIPKSLATSVYEVEQILRLEWDATDAAAVLIEDFHGGSGAQIWIGIVDGKDANLAKLSAILRTKGIDVPMRLFDLTSIPRGSNGKLNRSQLKSVMIDLANRIAVN